MHLQILQVADIYVSLGFSKHCDIHTTLFLLHPFLHVYFQDLEFSYLQHRYLIANPTAFTFLYTFKKVSLFLSACDLHVFCEIFRAEQVWCRLCLVELKVSTSNFKASLPCTRLALFCFQMDHLMGFGCIERKQLPRRKI